MSDVPELDRIIEDHKIFKSNMEWERSERMTLAGFRVMIAIVPTIMLVMLLGAAGLLILPPLWLSCLRLIPDPPRRDPFVRYNRK